MAIKFLQISQQMFSNDNLQNRRGLSLPFEIIEMMDKRTDFRTHSRLRATCKHFHQFLPLGKVVNFKTFERFVIKYKFEGGPYSERERRRHFQEQIQLDISPSALNQTQFEFLCYQTFDYQICRVLSAVLDNPSAYKHINLDYSSRSKYLLNASRIGDVDLVKRLLLVPNLVQAARRNRAIRDAALYGQLETVRFFLQIPTVDPSHNDNNALKTAARVEVCHSEVCSLLLTDPRVLACYRNQPFDLPAGVVIPPVLSDITA